MYLDALHSVPKIFLGILSTNQVGKKHYFFDVVEYYHVENIG